MPEHLEHISLPSTLTRDVFATSMEQPSHEPISAEAVSEGAAGSAEEEVSVSAASVPSSAGVQPVTKARQAIAKIEVRKIFFITWT